MCMNFKTTECAENADSFMTRMAINEITECAENAMVWGHA